MITRGRNGWEASNSNWTTTEMKGMGVTPQGWEEGAQNI